MFVTITLALREQQMVGSPCSMFDLLHIPTGRYYEGQRSAVIAAS